MTTNGSPDGDDGPDDDGPPHGDIPHHVRRAVLDRDNERCRRCGEEAPEKLTLHHVTYRSRGGGHHADNLVTLCWPCHAEIHRGDLRVARIAGRWRFAARDVGPLPGLARPHW